MNKRWRISQWNTIRSQTIEFQVIENCRMQGDGNWVVYYLQGHSFYLAGVFENI